MLVIRLLRTGKRNQPFFKIVVTDKRKPPRGGRFKEDVGFLNPLTKEKKLKAERIKYWISVGAKPSNTIYNLLVKENILEGRKIPVHKKKKSKQGEKVQSAEKPESMEKPSEGEPVIEKEPEASEPKQLKTEETEVKEELKPEEAES
ncbi:MAG: 30S ribosomal protein S16 [Candidatus Pacebacteria bacterium]|nr:30S ribosomal protein S16 [Candidatus Paceibacterota bacterium]